MLLQPGKEPDVGEAVRITKGVELFFWPECRQHSSIVLDLAIEGRFPKRDLVTVGVELNVDQVAWQGATFGRRHDLLPALGEKPFEIDANTTSE